MSKQKKTKPFHLVITNNETGEVINDLDFDALVGAIHIGGDTCGGIILSQCSAMAMGETLASAKATIQKAVNEDMPAALVMMMVEAKIAEETEEPQNQEENEEKGE